MNARIVEPIERIIRLQRKLEQLEHVGNESEERGAAEVLPDSDNSLSREIRKLLETISDNDNDSNDENDWDNFLLSRALALLSISYSLLRVPSSS